MTNRSSERLSLKVLQMEENPRGTFWKLKHLGDKARRRPALLERITSPVGWVVAIGERIAIHDGFHRFASDLSKPYVTLTP